jgi:hypothetical protein
MPRRSLLISALAALLVGVWFASAGDDFPLDDAWIHLAYAKSLRLGEGFSYNPNDFETGASSPLWALLLALIPLSVAPVVAVKALGVLLHAGLAALTADVAARFVPDDAVEERPLLALVAGLLCASEPLLAQAAVSGMEVTLTALLLMAVVQALSASAIGRGCVLAALAVLARPESLPFVLALAACQVAATRSLRWLGPALAGVGALALWIGYDYAVSGYPWPNTKYAKAGGFHPESLLYFTRLFSSAPWVMSVAGAVLFARGLFGAFTGRRWLPLAVAAAWLATLLSIALSRSLYENVLLYQSRYFVILGALPCALLPLGLLGLTRRLRLFALALVLAGVAVTAPASRAELARLVDDVVRLHTEPARFVAAQLPSHARVLAEGAGALRYFAPRSMYIVDMLGLNDASIVHAREVSGRAYACAIVARAPDHAVIPTEQMRSVLRVFQAEPIRKFTDPEFTQVLPPRERSEFVLRLVGVKIPCPAPGH